jgi:hypothetical protein
MSRIALLRGGGVAAVFAAGVAASLVLTPQAQPRPADCVIGDVCLTTPLPTVPLPLPLPTETSPTTSTAPPPTQSAPATTATTPAPASTSPAAPAEPAPNAQPFTALKAIRVSVTGKGAKRVLSVTLTLARPSIVNLHVGFRPRAVRTAFELGPGRHVRKVHIPARTRAGRYLLTLTVRSSETGVETHRRTVSVRR